MRAYGFSKESLTFFYTYLKRRNQCFKTNNTYSVYQLLLSGKSVKFLGIHIDQKSAIDEHVSSLCKKASNQFNAISRLHIRYLAFKERETLINGFVYSNFNYCLLIWHICSVKSVKKIDKIQGRALKILHNNFECKNRTLRKIP